jgi:hypothetical protein
MLPAVSATAQFWEPTSKNCSARLKSRRLPARSKRSIASSSRVAEEPVKATPIAVSSPAGPAGAVISGPLFRRGTTSVAAGTVTPLERTPATSATTSSGAPSTRLTRNVSGMVTKGSATPL